MTTPPYAAANPALSGGPSSTPSGAPLSGGTVPSNPVTAAVQALGGGSTSTTSLPAYLQNLTDGQQKMLFDLWENTYGWRPASLDELVNDPAVRSGTIDLQTLVGQIPPDFSGQLVNDTGVMNDTVVGYNQAINAGVEAKQATADNQAGQSGYIAAAVDANPRSAPFMQQILQSASTYNVPWQLIWGIADHESAQTWDPSVPGDNGQSHGLAQIYSPAHPEVSIGQATDPQFAINFIAQNLAQHYSQFHDWSLAVLAHNSPAAAQYMFDHGTHQSGRDAFDMTYVDSVMQGLDKLGFDTNSATGNFKIAQGASAGNYFKFPDQANATDTIKQDFQNLFLRPPTDQEVQSLLGVVNNAFISANEMKAAQVNPFTSPGSHDQSPVQSPMQGKSGIIAPVNGKVSQKFGENGEQGVDLAVPVGTPVLAPVDGYVHTQDDPGGFYKFVTIKGNDGRTYVIGHLSEFQVQDGAQIKAGQQIALSGGAAGQGSSTGPHIELQIRLPSGGVGPQGQIDPLQVLQGATQLSGHDETMSGSLASAAGGSGGTGDPNDPNNPLNTAGIDWNARIVQAMRNSPEYQQLYKNKPGSQTEQQYASGFLQDTAQVSGTENDSAAKLGMEMNNPDAASAAAAYQASGQPNSTFEELMAKKALEFEKLVGGGVGPGPGQ